MSAPPEMITVKRKRGTETPLHFLRLESNKRHRSDDFVYQRRTDEPLSPAVSVKVQNGIRPIIHTSKPGDENRPVRHIKSLKPRRAASPNPITLNPAEASSPKAIETEQQRFFFLKRTRKDSSADKTGHGTKTHQNSAILFVERRQKKHKSIPEEYENHVARLPTNEASSMPQKIKESARRLKKPGIVRQAVSSQQEIPKIILATEAPSVESVLKLREWALQETKLEAPKPMRYKPKPCKRFSERHPGYKPESTREEATKMGGYESEDSDDSYITETYIRVPAHVMERTSGPAVGMLVLRDDSDIELFYENDRESEDEFDDDDSNEENYYANDYPDEEEHAWSEDDELEDPPQARRSNWVECDSDEDADDVQNEPLRTNPWTEMYM